jgi:hypothetical protein
MNGFLVYVIRKAGTPDAYIFEDFGSAKEALTRLERRIDTGRAIGIGLVQVRDDGKLSPIQFVSTNGNLFYKRARQFERRWCRRNSA